MPSLNMGLSYPLNLEEVKSRILPGKIGNFAFGYLNDNGVFIVRLIGRSDHDLQYHVMHAILNQENTQNLKFERFKFSYASSVQEAYLKECRNYHDFGGDRNRLLNTSHPVSPNSMIYKCPICNQ